jgi:hypothetical protein
MLVRGIGFYQNYVLTTTTTAAPVSGIRRLAVSQSLWAYYDIAFTQSYSASGQNTVFDLSGNGNNGTRQGTVNYDSASISGSVLRLGASSQANRVDMPSLTLSGGTTWVMAWYMNSASYQFNSTEFFAGRDPEGYGMFAQNGTFNNRVLPIINDTIVLDVTPTGSALSGSWHISQFSFDDVTNNVNWCMDGTTGSYTLTAAISTGTITPKWNFNASNLPNRWLNSGSMMQVMALYTGSLTTQQLLDNHNSLKARYGL